MFEEEKYKKFTKTEQAIFFTVFIGPILFHLGFKTIVWPTAYKLESENARPRILNQINSQERLYGKVKKEIQDLQFNVAFQLLEENEIHKVEYSSLVLPKIQILYMSEQAAFEGFYALDDIYREKHKEMYGWYHQLKQLRDLKFSNVKNWHYISRDHFKQKRYKYLFKLPKSFKEGNTLEKFILYRPQFTGDFHPNIKQAIFDKLENFHDNRSIAVENLK